VRGSLLAVCALAVLASSASGATPASGLYGVVTRGPVTPVCVAERPCSRPVAGATVVVARAGLTRRAVTDRLGRYRIGVEAGRYTVRVLIGGGFQRARPTSVVVPAAQYVRVSFSVDTGIR
jgi:hypothetical protein